MLSINLSMAQVDLNEGLVAYYPFDLNAEDYSGYAHHGEVMGAQLTEGKIGMAYDFDGTDDYVQVDHSPALKFDTGEEFAISLWFKRDIAGEQFVQGDLISIWESEDVKDPYSYAIRFFTQVSDRPGEIAAGRFDSNDFDCRNIPYMYSPPCRGQSWYHMVFQLQGNMLQLYINGALVSEIIDNTECTLPTDSPLFIGTRSTSFDNANNRPFSGAIDEVRIYNRFMTLAEIEELSSITSTSILVDEDDIKVYPTITRGIVYVESDSEYLVDEVEVYNLHGQLLIRTNAKQLEITNKGMHIIKVSTKNNTSIWKKIIVVE